MLYWERIDPATANMLQKLSGTGILRDYYLSGGTALSLQIGHRVSVDLDFFTKKRRANWTVNRCSADSRRVSNHRQSMSHTDPSTRFGWT